MLDRFGGEGVMEGLGGKLYGILYCLLFWGSMEVSAAPQPFYSFKLVDGLGSYTACILNNFLK